MAEERHHQCLSCRRHKGQEDTISVDVTFTAGETYVGRDYSPKAAHVNIGHDYSQTTEETDHEDYESEKYGRTQKEHLDECMEVYEWL
ncbi:hypothetical protein KSP39_PZI006258 [Platanthera zijinensis]|uniref:Uncharacterized protein n=1 Tax=Platanthera zijinensis TaxID=2320716 RepID=A0AAP0BR14_9ASPA